MPRLTHRVKPFESELTMAFAALRADRLIATAIPINPATYMVAGLIGDQKSNSKLGAGEVFRQ